MFEPKEVDFGKEKRCLINEIRMKSEVLYNLYNMPGGSREIALAKTNLEQSVMWATKVLSGNAIK